MSKRSRVTAASASDEAPASSATVPSASPGGPAPRYVRAMITMKTKYALKALAYLATAPPEAPVLIAEISEKEGIPKKFLELILAELKQHGFVRSRKGRGGGYFLAAEPQKIPIAGIIRVLDGPIAPVPCLSRTSYQPCDGCKDEATCGVRLVLQDLYEASVRILESTSLADLVKKVETASKEGPPLLRYFI
jgi:Rrf2 family protein